MPSNKAVKMNGLWIEIGEFIVVIGNGIFVHIHFRGFDKFFGIGISENKLFLGCDPVLIFEGKELTLK